MQSKKVWTNFWVNEKQASSVNVFFYLFFYLDTTTHQLVSILDLALKFNCLPLLVLEAKRKLFGETCSVSLYFGRCVCAAVPVSAEKQNQALPPWQVKSA